MKISILSSLTACACLAGLQTAGAATSLFDVPSAYWDFFGGEAHGNGMIGYTFMVMKSVTVTQVGWYDAQANGLSRAFQVGLWRDLTGGNFSPGSSTSQLLGSSSTGISIPGGTNAVLNGVWRVVELESPLVLEPGSYQIGGLDTANTIDQITYVYVVGDMLSNNNAWVGQFFYSGTTSSAPGFHVTDSNHFYLAGGVELGPMLFIVPEPSALFLSAIGLGGLLSIRRRGVF